MAGAGSLRFASAFAAVVALCLSAAAPSAARIRADDDDRVERIVHFASDVTVETNGTLRVRETITVNTRGYEIKRGIFRDFPTRYKDGMHVGFTVVRVLRDGRDEPYSIENLENGRRVRIGDAAVFLDPGLYTYTIEYTTDRQLAFLANFDEVYWNVTGNDWAFRIDDAEATVHLPSGARILQYASYTGPQGAKGVPARVELTGANTIRFRTKEALNAREGLTIGVGFTKGAVLPPSIADRLSYFVRDHGPLAAFAIGLAILLAYFATVWLIGGRDPKAGTVIPLFEPPEDLSPASLRYVERMGYDGKMFSSVLVSMAVKGFLTITQEGKAYILNRTGAKAKDAGLAADEAEAARELFAHGDTTVELVQKNHTVINKAIGALSRWLSLHFDHGYVRGNWSLFWPGLIIAGIVMITVLAYSDNALGAFLVTLWSSLSLMGALAFGIGCVALWIDVFRGGKGSLILAILLLLPTAAFAGMTVGAMFFIFDTVPPYTPVLIWALVPVLVIFRRLLKAPTPEGAKLLTAIKGFRLFLTTAEEDRLKALNPPEVTPKLFERFLPYAIALDCETEWGRKFEAAAARAGMTPAEAQSFQPTWYSGQSFGDIGSGGFTQSVGAALATATASASVSPSSSSYSSSSSSSSFSSGSSGGGSSGGGGGGGGGGGW